MDNNYQPLLSNNRYVLQGNPCFSNSYLWISMDNIDFWISMDNSIVYHLWISMDK